MLDINEAFRMLATSNRFVNERHDDKTLLVYIGQWKSGNLSRAKMEAMLRKYRFKEVTPPTYNPPDEYKHV